MTSKRGSLSAALKEISGRPEAARIVAEAEPQESPPAKAGRGGRAGKVPIAGYFDPEVSKQFKKLAIDTDVRTVQDLLREAINDLFEKHGLSRIA